MSCDRTATSCRLGRSVGWAGVLSSSLIASHPLFSVPKFVMEQIQVAPPGQFKTLEQFIIEQQDQFPHSSGSFSRLLRDISVAAKIVNRDMRRAGSVDGSGDSGEINVQGEGQQTMDSRANSESLIAIKRSGADRDI